MVSDQLRALYLQSQLKPPDPGQERHVFEATSQKCDALDDPFVGTDQLTIAELQELERPHGWFDVPEEVQS